MTHRVALPGALLTAAVLVVGVTSACASPLSFSQLSQQAHGVPVPRGVAFVKERHSVENGAGFTSNTFDEVTLTYSDALPCTTLQKRWLAALRRAGRSFRLVLEPRLFVSSGQVEIRVTDRPGNLGITLGSTTTSGSYVGCEKPVVWSFD